MLWVKEWQRELAEASGAAEGVEKRLERIPEVREARRHAEELELRAYKIPAPDEEYAQTDRERWSESQRNAGSSDGAESADVWSAYDELSARVEERADLLNDSSWDGEATYEEHIARAREATIQKMDRDYAQLTQERDRAPLEQAWQRHRELLEKHRPGAEREEAEAQARYEEMRERVESLRWALAWKPGIEAARESADRARETLRERWSEASAARMGLRECERWAKEERKTWRGEHGLRAWLHDRGVLRAEALERIDRTVEDVRAEGAVATSAWKTAREESKKASERYETLIEKFRPEVEREYAAEKREREEGRVIEAEGVSVRGARVELGRDADLRASDRECGGELER